MSLEEADEIPLYDDFSSNDNKLASQTVILPPEKVTPWLTSRTRKISNFWLLFHSEIIDFSMYIQGDVEEQRKRNDCYEFVKSVFETKIEGGQLFEFGSFATSLSLKNADIDLVLKHPSFTAKKLMKLAYTVVKELETAFDNVEVIKSAKVPLIKFRAINFNCEIDLCFNEVGGVEDLNFVNRAIEALPEAKPIYLVLKLFFKQRKLNNSYHGGIGSFLLFTLVYNYLLLEKETRRKSGLRTETHEVTLGYLLLGFLNHYGMQFDFRNLKIDFNREGREVKKEIPMAGLSVHLPGKSENIASSCFRFAEICKIMKNRCMWLQSVVLTPGESILRHLINPQSVDFAQYEDH